MKMKICDLIAFRLLFIFELVAIINIGICFSMTKQFWDIPTYILGGLALVCFITQLFILLGNDYIEFNEDEIIVFFRKKEHKFSWKDISNPVYFSFSAIIFLSHNRLEISITDENGTLKFFNKFDSKQIHCNKKQFNKFYELFMLSREKREPEEQIKREEMGLK